MDFVPYKSNEILENKYYQIPQELFENEKYKNKLNSDSKILYAFLLDRLSLSQRNHWIDDKYRIYLIFTREEVGEKLNLSEKTVIKAFKQLTEVALIQEKRQGLGKPNLIYVGKIQHEEISENESAKYEISKNKIQENEIAENEGLKNKIIKNEIPEQENLQLQNCNFYSSRDVKSTVQELENLQGINTNNINTNIINTDTINPNSEDEVALKEIKERCKLNEFTKDEIPVLEDVIDTLYYKDNLKVGNVTINHFKILEKLKLIVKDNLIQLLEILKKTPNIQNAKNYLMICLYNNLGNRNIFNFAQKNISRNNNNNAYANKENEEDSFAYLCKNFVYANEARAT